LDLTGRVYRVAEDLFYCPAQPPIYSLGTDPLAAAAFEVDQDLLRRVTKPAARTTTDADPARARDGPARAVTRTR
jgi:hypothetical protein